MVSAQCYETQKGVRAMIAQGLLPMAWTAAALRMMEHNISCLPVIDADARLIGIITSRDLLRWVKARQSDTTLSA